MEDFLGISVVMAVGEDVNGQGSNCQVSLISKRDSSLRSSVLSHTADHEHGLSSPPAKNQSSLFFLNGVNDDENHQTDDELDDINKKSLSTWSNISPNLESGQPSIPRELPQILSEVLPTESSSVYPATSSSEKFESASTDFGTSQPCFDSARSIAGCCASPCSNETFGSCPSEESANSYASNTLSRDKHKRPVKNEAEHMLLAVREIKTPWAKELEKRLAKEIELDNKGKKSMNAIRRNKKKSREHENLMKAMKEIGTGWAQEIERANYLKSRNRERVNYNVSQRIKPKEVPKPKVNILNHVEEDRCLIRLKKLSRSSLNQESVIKKIKSGTKNQSTAQMLLKKAVNEKRKMSVVNSKVKAELKKTVSANKPKLKAKDKPNKIDKQKRVVIPQTSRSKTQVPSLMNNSPNGVASDTVKKPISNMIHDKLVKGVKVNHFSENSLKNIGRVKACISNAVPTMKQRHSARQQDQSSVFKEIGVKKHLNFVQIILLNKQNAAFLSVQALKELRSVFASARHDPSCKLIFLNGSGRVFCSGVDLTSICFRDNLKIATELSVALRDFLKILLAFPKPIVAGVNGSALGLGVTILPICDLVYASDKATFSTPYAKLSQVPEGGASFSFPHILGPAIASDMLLGGRVLTAQEACQYGLVSQVIWPSQFMETLIPKVEKLASESSQGMEATKQLMKACFKSQLEAHIDKECCLLKEQWTSQACQKAIHQMMQSRHFLYI